MDHKDDNDIGTVRDACRVIGGRKPINPATFYRGVKAGRYSILKPSPGVTRVDLAKLREEIRAAGEAK